MQVLGIDVGTGGTRAVILDEHGRILASATEEHDPFTSPQIGWAEQNPKDWWRACRSAVQNVLARAELRGDQIACVRFSGQMHGAVMLDELDEVVRPALIWCDVRTEKQCSGTDRKNRRRGTYSPYLQSCAAQFHSHQTFVGTGKRARELEAGPVGHAAQGLCSLPAFRRPGD